MVPLSGARAGLVQTITDGYGKRIALGYQAWVRSPILGGSNGPPPLVPTNHPTTTLPTVKKPNCDKPYFYDAKGNKVFREECL